jgi:hypothetical protein
LYDIPFLAVLFERDVALRLADQIISNFVWNLGAKFAGSVSLGFSDCENAVREAAAMHKIYATNNFSLNISLLPCST